MIETSKQFDTVIIGLGNTGYACARFLYNKNIRFAVTDSRSDPPMLSAMQKDFPDIPLSLGGFDKALMLSAEKLLLSPGVSLHEDKIAAAIKAGVAVYGDVELFSQHVNAPVIAVTGSNGKSTVTTLFAEMAHQAGLNVVIGGNLGTPALDLLQDSKTDLYVLELSSFQLETVSSLNAAATVVLNISEDHMDRYRTLADYAAAKARIYSGNGVKVINLDDPFVVGMKGNSENILEFTLGEPTDDVYGTRVYDEERWLVKGDKKLIPVSKLKIRGDHNIANALATLALGDAYSLPRESMFKVLQEFPGLPHRCQYIAEINNIAWFNDSKGTNVGATCAAIKGLAKNSNMVLIAGGEGKGADFNPLAEVAEGRLRAAIVIGRDGSLIKHCLQDKIPVHEAVDMESAVRIAVEHALPGDIVLLSPACASFDMYKDYQDRGNQFIEAVNKLDAVE